QDIETVEYFFAHTIAPAIVAVLVPCAVLAWLAASAWPLALALAPFLAYAGSSPFLRRRHVDALPARSRLALGGLAAHRPDTIQGMPEILAFGAASRRREAFTTAARRYQALRLALLDDLARQSERLELATGLGGLTIAILGAKLAAAGTV